MSLYSALFTGVAGLKAETTAMAGVADNIANINTVGYKAISTEFNTFVSNSRKVGDFVAGGVGASARTLVSRQGILAPSGGATDVGIDGAGFFVVRGGTPNSPEVAFTRAGNFAPDPQGFLRNSGGYYLQGWRLDSLGAPLGSAIENVEPVSVAGLSGSAEATTKLTFGANLDASTTAFSGAYVAGNMATGTVTPNFLRSVQVSDAQGNDHRVELGYLKTGINTWQVEVYAQPATDVTAANGVVANGTLKFNADGTLDVVGSSPSLFLPLSVSWTNGAGSTPITLDLESSGAQNGLTQLGSPSVLNRAEADGGVLGNVSSVSIDSNGVVSAVFDNGKKRPIFQLPIATFRNPDGLTRLSGNAFATSPESGSFSINAPGVLSGGTIATGVLEASNADLANEFTNMIRFQRAYSASSKIITTVDEMLQEANNLKR